MVHGKPQVSLYETSEAKKYKKFFANYVKEQANLQNWSLTPNKTQHFYVDCVFYFDRVDKDANNYFKLLLDSITDTQLIWLDDNVVCERVNGIFYDSKNPHIDITIYPVEYVGIFPTVTQLDCFESNCITCSKYKNNCSILKKAKEGRVQDEIVDFQCSKYKKIKYKYCGGVYYVKKTIDFKYIKTKTFKSFFTKKSFVRHRWQKL